MASYYKRKNSPYYWIKFTDPDTGELVRESTNHWIRPDGSITPARVDRKDGEQLAKKICKEIDAAKRLNVSRSFFVTSKDTTPIREAFAHFKRMNSRRSEKTLKEYDWFYGVFTQTFDPKRPVHILTKDTVEEWLLSLDHLYYYRNKKVDGKTVKEKRAYAANTKFIFQKDLVKFLNFLFEYKYLTEYFVINKDVRVRPEVREKIIFSVADITKILEHLGEKPSNFQISIYLLLYTGLRSTEILSIEGKRIDLDRESFQYYSRKSKDWRTVPIHPELIGKIKDRLKEVGEGRLSEYNDEQALNRAFKRYLKTLGLDKKGYTARTFRKSFDTWAYDSDVDTVANSRLVGHSIATAEKHYREVEIEKLRKELHKFKVPSQKGHNQGHTEK